MIILILALNGCASSHVVRQPVAPITGTTPVTYTIGSILAQSERPVPSHFIAAIEGYLKAEFEKRGLATGDLADRELDEVDTYNVTALGGDSDISRMHAEEIVDFLQGKTD